MAQLRLDYPEFTSRQAEIIVVGPEKPEKFGSFWKKEQIPFIGIPDPQHAVAKIFGQQVKLLKLGRMPAIVIVDKTGNIRYRHYGNSMTDIPKDEVILSVLDELNSEEG